MKTTVWVLLALLVVQGAFNPSCVFAQETTTTTTSTASGQAEAAGDETASITTTTTTSTEEDSSPQSEEERVAYCERNCVVEALSGDWYEDLPERCDSWCPEYSLPFEALDPAAVCTNCPDETCSSCSCDSGECQSDSEPETLAMEGYDDITYVVAEATTGSPVDSFVCASCSPRRQCRRMWWC